MVSFSIIIPTKGRPSLVETLSSVALQLESGDEVIVERLDCPWGGRARNKGQARASGSHLIFMDDDDVFLPASLLLLRDWVEEDRERVHLYPMRLNDGQLSPPVWPLRCGTIGTPMFCVPNVEGKVGFWSDRYETDFDFIYSTMRLRGDVPILHNHPVALIRPRG